jgi:hypothetical protein
MSQVSSVLRALVVRLELHRSMRLLLHYCRAGSQHSSSNDVADLHLYDVAAAQLAVDRKVKQSAVAQTPKSSDGSANL